MAKQNQSRKQSKSRKQKQRKSRQRKTRQRGGDASLVQGQAFANVHRAQHGGSRELVGAPLGYTGVLDAGMRGAAGLEKYDAHFAQAQAQAGGSRSRRAMRGGAMSPAEVSQAYTLLPSYAGAGVPPPSSVSLASQASPSSMSNSAESLLQPSVKGGRRQRNNSKKSKSKSKKSKSKSKKSKRNQRGGFSPVGSPSMLLSNSDYDKAGLHSDFKNPLLK